MPIRSESVPAEVYLEHLGAKIFHSYRNNDVDAGTRDFWFSVIEDSNENGRDSFHVPTIATTLNLPQNAGERMEDWTKRVTIAAIEHDAPIIAAALGHESDPAAALGMVEDGTVLCWEPENYPGREAEPPVPVPGTCPFPFETKPYLLPRRIAVALCNWLMLIRSAWFECVPYPDDMFRVTVKTEHASHVDRLIDLTLF